jgi:small subunit ribosomal protein S13
VARISNVNIPDNKKIPFSLAYIYGIGRPLGQEICKNLNIDPDKRVKDLTEKELISLRDHIANNYVVETDLKRKVSMDIKKKMDIVCYQGLRHRKKLPVRGQNTHSNARTRKGKASPIANKKTPGK